MRYYRYGCDNTKREIETEEKWQKNVMGRFGELIIDEDTVYEIDEECLQCQNETQFLSAGSMLHRKTGMAVKRPSRFFEKGHRIEKKGM